MTCLQSSSSKEAWQLSLDEACFNNDDMEHNHQKRITPSPQENGHSRQECSLVAFLTIRLPWWLTSLSMLRFALPWSSMS